MNGEVLIAVLILNKHKTVGSVEFTEPTIVCLFLTDILTPYQKYRKFHRPYKTRVYPYILTRTLQQPHPSISSRPHSIQYHLRIKSYYQHYRRHNKNH